VHARSTTIQAEPSSIEAGLRQVREEVLPALTDIDGFTGISLLVDRESGRCIATSAWRSEEAMHASAQQVGPIRDRVVQSFGAGAADVEEWEIAVLHRDHTSGDGACCRVSWVQGDRASLDRAVDSFRSSLPAIEETGGFCSASVMLNRTAGRAVTSVAYDSLDAMRRTAKRADEIRRRGTAQAGVEVLDVHEFELALAHLRVPELA
jgi:quinol monooxygenase YgiN